MTEDMTLGGLMRAIVGVGLMLALLWGAAYLDGVMEMLFTEENTPEAYGTPSLYEKWNNPVMPVFVWQGKEDTDPRAVQEGETISGGVAGNITAFSLKQVTPIEPVSSVGWTHFSEARLNEGYYYAPVMTIKNKFGGKIRAVYEYSTWRDEDDPDKYKAALVWSPDAAFVPTADLSHRPSGIVPYLYNGRIDVQMDWGGVVESEGQMVLYVPGTTGFPTSRNSRFNMNYPGGGIMETVYRRVQKSHLILYALDPEDENRILATAHLELTAYSRWRDEITSALSEEQVDVLRRLDIPNHSFCMVEMAEYEEEVILE